MLLSSNERGSRGTRNIFYSVVILSSAHRKLLSLVSANGRPDAAADPGQHDLASWPHSPGMKPLPAPACSCLFLPSPAVPHPPSQHCRATGTGSSIRALIS